MLQGLGGVAGVCRAVDDGTCGPRGLESGAGGGILAPAEVSEGGVGRRENRSEGTETEPAQREVGTDVAMGGGSSRQPGEGLSWQPLVRRFGEGGQAVMQRSGKEKEACPSESRLGCVHTTLAPVDSNARLRACKNPQVHLRLSSGSP